MDSLERVKTEDAVAPAGNSLSGNGPLRLSGARILVVDDDPTVHAIVGKSILTQCGRGVKEIIHA